jgi:hypothetical protein
MGLNAIAIGANSQTNLTFPGVVRAIAAKTLEKWD